MNTRMQRVGEMLRQFVTWYSLTTCSAGWFVALALNAVLPPLAVVSLGSAFVDSTRAAPEWPGNGTYIAQGIVLLVLLTCLWLSRLQHRGVSLGASLAYIAAGVTFIALEARTGASFDLGVWPTWSGASLLDILKFCWGFWSSPTGWVMMLWVFSALTMLGCALSGELDRERAPIEREALNEGRKGSTASRVVKPSRRLDQLAGMSGLKHELRKFAANFEHYDRRQAKASDINGLLLGGPPGNGKSVFAEALAAEMGFGFLKVGVKDLASQWVNDTPGKIGEVFADAVAHAPCVLFLDEIDAIAQDRGGISAAPHAEDLKAVNTLLQEIDNMRSKRVVLVAASNYVDRLDAAVIRPGRFDVKIEIPHPDLEAREGMLVGMLAAAGLTVEAGTAQAVAKLWERRSAAFIESTVKKVREDMRRLGRVSVKAEDLKAAARSASRREGSIPKTGTPLSKLVLPATVRRDADSIVYRLKNWEQLALRGGTPPTGVLLYGPPGTGKTNLVRAIALELGDWHVFEVKVAQMLADPRTFEKVLAQACEHRPAIVFLDEADDLLRDRSYSANATATNEILKAMDGMMGAVPEVVFVAATNSPDVIDAAAKRGGRFGEKLFMDLLDGEELMEFAGSELARRDPVRFEEDVTPEWLTSICAPIGPADFVAVLSKAINSSLTSSVSQALTREDLIDAYVSVMERRPVRAE